MIADVRPAGSRGSLIEQRQAVGGNVTQFRTLSTPRRGQATACRRGCLDGRNGRGPALAEIVHRRGLERAGEVLSRWAV